MIFHEEVLGGGLYDKVLNERYIGKTPDLEECERLLDEVVVSVRDGKKLPTHDENRSKIDRVEEILAKRFNFLDVVLDSGHLTTGLAFTIPNNTVVDYAYEVELTSDGYRYKRPYFPCVIRIDKDVFSMAESGAEVLGVILHEIGHNFYYMPLMGKMVGTVFIIHAMLGKYVLFLKNKVQYTVLRPLLNFLEKDAGLLSKALGFVDMIFSWAAFRKENYGFSKLFNIFMVLLSPIGYISSLMSHLFQSAIVLGASAGTGYTNEKFSDDFATVYGYGADMNRLLLRLHVPEDNDERSFVQSIGEIGSTLIMLPIHVLDVHPFIGARLSNAEQRLRKELSATKNPKMKKIIERDLTSVLAAKKRFQEHVKSGKILDISFLDKYVKDPVFNRGKDAMDEVDAKAEGRDRTLAQKIF